MILHLNPIKMKIIGIVEFEAKSPIHVGIGGDEVVRDLIRLPGGELVIPSSTWKGMFRNLSEQLARQAKFGGLAGLAVELYSEKMGISYRSNEEKFRKYLENFVRALQGGESNIPHGARELEEILVGLGYAIEEVKEVRERGLSAEKELLEAMAEEYLALHCPVSKLYGNKMAGKIRFFDSLIMATPSLRPGIGIDRKSGKVKENLLYFINAMPRGRIVLKMVMDNLLRGEEDSRLFASTLKLVKTLGVSIGARKSAGLGHLELIGGEFYILDTESDGRTVEFRIGNPLRKAERVSFDRFVEWLCP
ncbi:MAG: hypothetical protein HA496_02190 [Thaumarchaeota archaeon]|nr:hypothetical protein [Nitrososphaerota archaeon]